LRALADQGWTIFYSSHALDVVQQVCDRIIILDEGKVVAAGPYAELARTSGAKNLEGLFTQLTDRGDEESRLAGILQGLH
jgi:ABC-2 type transport system ATP-binding protein